jgi:hypothetical protein
MLAAVSAFVIIRIGLPARPLFLIAVAWLAVFVFALAAFRRRGLWVLASAPLAFVPGALLFAYVASCGPSSGCL